MELGTCSTTLLFLLTVLFSFVGADSLVPWTSLKDIHATLEAPQPTLATGFSFGAVTYKRQSKAVQGYSVFRGYDAAGTLRSVVISSGTSATATFLPDDDSVTLTATPDSFMIDFPHNNHTSHEHPDHHCANEDSPVEEAVHHFRPQNTEPKNGKEFYVGEVPITSPHLRNFRIVFSTSEPYLKSKHWDNATFEAQCILATEVLNTWFERDLGIHLVYITYIVSPTNLYTKRLYSIGKFYNDNLSDKTYDVGLFIEHRQVGIYGLCNVGGAYSREPGGKARCFSEMGYKTMAHELGHFFGGRHTFDGNKFEIGGGYSILSYGYMDVFAVGTLYQQMAYWHSSTKFQPLDKILNANNRPKIVTKGLKKNYTIPPSTPFRFTIDANDPDEGDQLLFFAQQLDYKYGVSYWAGTGKMFLKGKISLLPGKEVTMNRTFYFQNYSDGFLMSRILDSHEFGEEEKKYDIFLQVADKNDAKKVAYYTEYDAIVRNATLHLIKNNNSEVFNKMMNVSAITSAPWLPQRDYFHAEVWVEPTYAPFVLNINPMKVEYTAGEVVNLSWTYDNRVIPDGDHVTIRLSTDMKKSFPYTIASGVPVKNGSINVSIPYIRCVNSTDWFSWRIPGTSLSRGLYVPQGFFSVEHDEGIVFATTFIKGPLSTGLDRGNAGGFNITAEETRLLELQPAGTYVVDERNIKEVLTSFFVYDKKNMKNVTASYVLANGSTGEIIDSFHNLTESDAVLSTLRKNAGRYMKLAAVVGGSSTPATGRSMAASSTDAIRGNAFSMQLNGYNNATANFITNFVDLKAFSKSAIEEGKSEEEKQEEKDAEEQGNNAQNDDDTQNGDGTQNDDGTQNADEETEKDSGSTTDETVIEVSTNCDNTCHSCSQPLSYIADNQCHPVPHEATSDRRYYRASSCTEESDEQLVIYLYSTKECSDEGQQMSLSKSCGADITVSTMYKEK